MTIADDAREAVKRCAQCGAHMKPRRGQCPSGLARQRYCSRRCSGLALRPAFSWEKFYALVEKTESCWIWRGGTDKSYGRIWKDGRKQYVHRISYEKEKGASLGEMDACHKCDNTLCVNPDHLFPGTQADNNRDMFNKGRSKSSPGIKNTNAKLNEEAIRYIRSSSENLEILAERYGVTKQAISYVRRSVTWKHVP